LRGATGRCRPATPAAAAAGARVTGDDGVIARETDESAPPPGTRHRRTPIDGSVYSDNIHLHSTPVGSVAEWLACWTQAQKGLGSNRSRDAAG